MGVGKLAVQVFGIGFGAVLLAAAVGSISTEPAPAGELGKPTTVGSRAAELGDSRAAELADPTTTGSLGMQVVSSDKTARLVPLELGKSVVFDFPQDIQQVMVANPGTVKAVVHSHRRVAIIGANLGETNVYLYDAAARQIGALNVSVVSYPITDTESTQVVGIVRGEVVTSVSCTRTLCLGAEKPEAANTTHSDVVTHNRP